MREEEVVVAEVEVVQEVLVPRLDFDHLLVEVVDQDHQVLTPKVSGFDQLLVEVVDQDHQVLTPKSHLSEANQWNLHHLIRPNNLIDSDHYLKDLQRVIILLIQELLHQVGSPQQK